MTARQRLFDRSVGQPHVDTAASVARPPWSEPIIVAVFTKSKVDLPGGSLRKAGGGDVGAIPRYRLRDESEVCSYCNRSNAGSDADRNEQRY